MNVFISGQNLYITEKTDGDRHTDINKQHIGNKHTHEKTQRTQTDTISNRLHSMYDAQLQEN